VTLGGRGRSVLIILFKKEFYLKETMHDLLKFLEVLIFFT